MAFYIVLFNKWSGRSASLFWDIQCFETSVIILRCSESEMTYCLKTKGLGFALHLSSHNFRIQLADCQFNLALPWDSSTLAKTSEKEDLNLTKTFGLILQKFSPTLTTVHFSTFNFYNSLWKCCTFLLKKTLRNSFHLIMGCNRQHTMSGFS